VNPSSKTVTDVFPAIAVGNPDEVDVAWLGTNEIEPTGTLGKFDPGGWLGHPFRCRCIAAARR
jgi:hypothetical protein